MMNIESTKYGDNSCRSSSPPPPDPESRSLLLSYRSLGLYELDECDNDKNNVNKSDTATMDHSMAEMSHHAKVLHSRRFMSELKKSKFESNVIQIEDFNVQAIVSEAPKGKQIMPLKASSVTPAKSAFVDNPPKNTYSRQAIGSSGSTSASVSSSLSSSSSSSSSSCSSDSIEALSPETNESNVSEDKDKAKDRSIEALLYYLKEATKKQSNSVPSLQIVPEPIMEVEVQTEPNKEQTPTTMSVNGTAFKLPLSMQDYQKQHSETRDDSSKQHPIMMEKHQEDKSDSTTSALPIHRSPFTSTGQRRMKSLNVSMVSNFSEDDNSDDDDEEEGEDAEPPFDRSLSALENKLIWILEQPNLELYEKAPIGCPKWSKIWCHHCKSLFTYETLFGHVFYELLERTKEEFDIDSSGLCTHCMRPFKTPEEQHRHRLLMAKMGRFGNWHEFEAEHVCIFCPSGKSFDGRKEYIDHLFRYHRGCDLFMVCSLCGTRTNNSYEFISHMQLQHRAIYCTFCLQVFAPRRTWETDKGFESDHHLVKAIEEHLYQHLQMQEAFACDKCHLVFLDDSHLIRHKFVDHAKVINYFDDKDIGIWRNGNLVSLDDIPELLKEIPRTILSKKERNRLLSMMKPLSPQLMAMEEELETSPRKFTDITKIRAHYLKQFDNAQELQEEEKEEEKEEDKGEKGEGYITTVPFVDRSNFLNMSEVYILSEVIHKLPPPSLSIPSTGNILSDIENEELSKSLCCRECGYSLDIPCHFFSNPKVCTVFGCRYVSHCQMALANHPSHGHSYPKPIKLKLGTKKGEQQSENVIIPESIEKNYADALNLSNDKILICRTCNYLSPNLPDAFIHQRTKGHPHIVADDDGDEGSSDQHPSSNWNECEKDVGTAKKLKTL